MEILLSMLRAWIHQPTFWANIWFMRWPTPANICCVVFAQVSQPLVNVDNNDSLKT